MRNRAKIVDIQTVKQLQLQAGKRVLFVFDIDNTLIEPAEGSVGSDQWFDSLFQFINKFFTYPVIYNELKKTVLQLYSAVQRYVKVKPVEQETAEFIKFFQSAHIPVIALTARGPDLAEITQAQLKEAGIDFTPGSYKDCIKLMDGTRDQPVVYNKGIIYCSGNNKGECLRHYLHYYNLHPRHIRMMDDKRRNLEEVIKDLKSTLKLKSFLGFRYGFLDKKVKSTQTQKWQTEFVDKYSHNTDVYNLYCSLFSKAAYTTTVAHHCFLDTSTRENNFMKGNESKTFKKSNRQS